MIFVAFVALFIFFSLTARNFFTVRNVLTLALQTSTITIMGIGVTFTIITGGIDLSIGSVVALTRHGRGHGGQRRDADLAVHGHRPGFRGVLRSCNGLAHHRAQAAALHRHPRHDDGRSRRRADDHQRHVQAGAGRLRRTWATTPCSRLSQKFPGIAYPVFIMIIAAIVFGFFLRKTRMGRYTYAIGSNEEASRLSGIKVNRVKLIAYMICGFCAALTGIILASRMVTSQPNGGVSYELNAIASSVIGGTSLMGGIGTVGGAVIGSFIIGVLGVGLTMQGASYFVQQIVIGLVVIGSVAVDQLRYKKK